MYYPPPTSFPTDEETATTLVVFTCIYWCVWDRRDMSSDNSESFSCMQAIHCILCFLSYIEVFIIQSTTRRKRKGESNNPYLTLFFTWNVSVSYPLCTTLHCSPSDEFHMMMETFSATP
ncbi:hypothetical protein MS3_00000720 [Schistosoma haematobium]|uniref:Uncharacterized protein n=1 Tax=Schistosoma haematobium TaxID=6185 RepID=A0A922IJ55_SCHHA|nr:hypothetical protein MS3_00000720 [Schistosoma haematobium]KAH9580761.1 hypothetical protein MS3_00000720 [Schistosoma haematobium]